jgi:hypothetical protein
MPVPLDQARSIEDLSPNPLVYERTAFMEHIRRYDREALRSYYLGQPGEGARVWANYVVNLWEYEHGVEELTSHPWNITIPMTEVCNATCTFCSSPLVPNPKALAVHEVEHFADALGYALRVSLQGLGEPLAHPHFEEIAEEIRKYLNPVAQLEIITNGWLLSGQRWELLKSLRVGDIQVSVNAATDRTHQIAMGSRPGTFERVVTNIEAVLTDPEWRGFLKASMVVTRHSLAEVSQFLDLLTAKGVRIFQFNALLPLTTPDWGFGRTDQYLALWCGHLPSAAALVERAAAAIAEHRGRGITITAAPEQWLLPVSPSLRPGGIQLSTDQRSTAVFQDGAASTPYEPEWEPLCVRVDDQRIVLAPHEQHTDVTGREGDGVMFRGTPQSCRWAYLLRTPRLALRAGEYTLDVGAEIQSGDLYGGILDIERDDFIVQEQLHSGVTRIQFALAEDRLVDVVIRQGRDDSPVAAIYRWGRLSTSGGAKEPVVRELGTDRSDERPRVERSPQASSPPRFEPVESGTPGRSKPARIFCPMVYTTLSVFHHSLDVSICCYMENAPGHTQPCLKDAPLLHAYNDAGFKLVRRTLSTERHIPVCDSCPYGASRS